MIEANQFYRNGYYAHIFVNRSSQRAKAIKMSENKDMSRYNSYRPKRGWNYEGVVSDKEIIEWKWKGYCPAGQGSDREMLKNGKSLEGKKRLSVADTGYTTSPDSDDVLETKGCCVLM